ncbi:MAG: hypothetical protein NTW86_23560, partial [Candidatus Sumerlaeota bacterium]|nr:hypothetical protein [Candidatus Sumerlaeota bacterium]
GEKGEEIAVVTRNRYGALVLNSARVLFADVDFPQRKPAGFWDSLLLSLSAERKRRQLQSLESETIEAVRRWRQRNPSRTLRIYRTPAGLRIALTNQLYDPASADTLQVLRDLGSDPLYIKLSQTQACFRARLTPKPWRCGCSLPPNQYPWENAEAERLYRAWESDYANRSSGFRACKLVESLGDGEMAEEASAVLEIHDSVACGQDASKLA